MPLYIPPTHSLGNHIGYMFLTLYNRGVLHVTVCLCAYMCIFLEVNKEFIQSVVGAVACKFTH